MHGIPPGEDAGVSHHQHRSAPLQVAMRIVVQMNQIGLEPTRQIEQPFTRGIDILPRDYPSIRACTMLS